MPMIYAKTLPDKRKKVSSGADTGALLCSDPLKVADHVIETQHILKAVLEGDYAAVSKRIATGQSLMSVREPGTGCSIAHVAARCGDKAILKLLVRKYSDYIKMSNNLGRTAVHEAAEQGKFVCLTYLLQHGAVCKTRDSKGVTPLMLSAQKGHLQTLRRLALEEPDSISCKDIKGLTALHHGSAAGQQKTIRWLVEFGADDQAKDMEGCNALHHAIINNRLKCAIWLQQFSECDVRHINNEGYNSCHLAAQCGHIGILHWLLSNKLVSPDEPGGKYGSTPVHEAAAYGQLESLRCLKSYGANMHKRNFNDKSPKDIATHCKQTECTRYLDSLKKPKHEKKEKRANSLTRFVQALAISGEDKTSKSTGLLIKTKRRTKDDFDKALSDNEDAFSPYPCEKLNFRTIRRGRSGSFNERHTPARFSYELDDSRSVYSNGSGGDRRSGNFRTSWDKPTLSSVSSTYSNNEQMSAVSPSSSFDIMSVLRDEKRRQMRLKQADLDDETMSMKSGSSYNGRGRSTSFLGSQDTMDRNSLGSPFNACSPSFGYVPSPPPRSVSIEAARSSVNSSEFDMRAMSPHYAVHESELRSVSDRSSLALSDSSGESNIRGYNFTKQPCPVHRAVSPARLTSGDFKKVFSERQNARVNARCTCRNSGELQNIPERNGSRSSSRNSSRNNNWVEDNSPHSTASTLSRKSDLGRLGLDNFKQNWGTKTLIHPGRTARSTSDYDSDNHQSTSPPFQNFGVSNGRYNQSPLPDSDKDSGVFLEPDFGYGKTYRDSTFRTSTNLSDICKL